MSFKGHRGPRGYRGRAGEDGLSSLIRTVALDQSSTQCPGVGGVRIDTGIDRNANGELDASEVQSPSAAICHGEDASSGDGRNGHNALILTSVEPPGDNCENGGVRVDSGTDTNDDGVLDTSGMTSDTLQPPSYICNASEVATAAEPPGENCRHGGQRLDVGADQDGDGELFYGEITSTLYFCDGLRFTAIDAGRSHTCALVSDGTVRCWGANRYGALGRETPQQSFVPISVYDLDDAVAIAVGGDQSCAITRDQYAVCWGANDNGEHNFIPNAVNLPDGSSLSEVIGISTSGSHSCAVLMGGRVYCWGGNEYGQLGDGTTVSRSTATAVLAAEGGSAGAELTGARSVAAGARHTCAVVDDGVFCWGYNGEGQLGTGDTVNSTRPRRVVEDGSGYLFDVSAVSAGLNQTCAIAHGRARCWGNNEFGALGSGSVGGYSAVPLGVYGDWGFLLAGIDSISTGYDASCAVAAPHGNSNVYCWGSNGHGQLGNGAMGLASRAGAVVGFDRAQSVTIGERHACALPRSGRPLCWGANAIGELGNGSYEPSTTAVEVAVQ